MNDSKKILNDFLVETFNEILRLEQTALENYSDNRLTISEIHVIEAVFKAIDSGDNTASAIAKLLKITLGSLTVAVQTLEKKGYLYRQRTSEDRRVVQIFPTPLARYVNLIHNRFHIDMVESVMQELSLEEQRVLVVALEKLKGFFSQKAAEVGQNKPQPSEEE